MSDLGLLLETIPSISEILCLPSPVHPDTLQRLDIIEELLLSTKLTKQEVCWLTQGWFKYYFILNGDLFAQSTSLISFFYFSFQSADDSLN